MKLFALRCRTSVCLYCRSELSIFNDPNIRNFPNKGEYDVHTRTCTNFISLDARLSWAQELSRNDGWIEHFAAVGVLLMERKWFDPFIKLIAFNLCLKYHRVHSWELGVNVFFFTFRHQRHFDVHENKYCSNHRAYPSSNHKKGKNETQSGGHSREENKFHQFYIHFCRSALGSYPTIFLRRLDLNSR